MHINQSRQYTSHGDGTFTTDNFSSIGSGVVFERDVMVFHPECIRIGSNVYIGHNTILKGYYKGVMEIGDGTWIGQNCFFHSAGNISIGKAVGIGPYVKILTSQHDILPDNIPILHMPLKMEKVVIGDGADIGIGSIILPGVNIGSGAVIGAGSVVTSDIAPFSIYAGVPAKMIRKRVINE